MNLCLTGPVKYFGVRLRIKAIKPVVWDNLSDDAKELLQLMKININGMRYQSIDGIFLSAAHELENVGLVMWKGDSFGSQFYCITQAGTLVPDSKL